METLHSLYTGLLADWTTTQDLLQHAWADGAVPPVSDLPFSSIITSVVLVNVLALMLTARGRRLLWDTFETIVASAIVVALLVALVCLPAGVVFGVFKLLAWLATLASMK
mmetsp:Transcript_23365/g.59913  ORF Transcript_23365/g.59913 Transcript_23365/m.59913 type:complete len:110 (-) Transcript_23365:175-504(-)|eukprot:jgi/Tetstr1/438440/TSEL_026997.t1